MGSHPPRQRRNSVDVLGYAILTGITVSASVTALGLPSFLVARQLATGAEWGAAWQTVLLDDDDWETAPVLLVMAVLGGVALAILTAAVWLFSADRVRPWAAHAAAALAAAAAACVLIFVSWPLAVVTAVVAGLVTLIAAPRVGFRRTTLVTGERGA